MVERAEIQRADADKALAACGLWLRVLPLNQVSVKRIEEMAAAFL